MSETVKEITSLPDTFEKVESHTLEFIVQTIEDLMNPSTKILGVAGMQVNAFLSYAAIKLAKNYRERELKNKTEQALEEVRKQGQS